MTRARLFAPLAALLLGLLATAAVIVWGARSEEARTRAQFESIADGAAAAVEGRMLAQLTMLRGAAGLFNASDTVSEADFRAYVARLRLDRYYPGVLGIGFAASLADADAADRLVAAARQDGHRTFRLWPGGAELPRSAIRFLEPMNRRNREALGFDMLSEPTRRAAMESARARNSAVMSGPVQLVQEIDAVKQPGFLIYLPVSRAGQDSSADARDTAHLGWVYSPLRAHDLFGAILSDRDLSQVVVEIMDAAPGKDRLLFRSGELDGASDYATERRLEIAGRHWIVRVTALPALEQGARRALLFTIALAGLLVSMLVGTIAYIQSRQNARTAREVELRTRELQMANELLREEAEARQQAEALVRQMQKMEAIGQLTGGIAHDFNNMLSIILGNLELAERRLGDPARVRRAIDHAREGAEKAADLTRRLLAFGRRQPLSPQVLDPNKLVAGMSELLRRALGETVRLETVLAGGLWPVCADAGQLENAILNLAINGRDAMPDGGALTIETANCHLDEGYARVHEGVEPGQYVLIAVSDTGQGMSPEVAERAFDPFFTTKEVGRGTGLGLSQVFGYVRQSDGHIKLYSEPGEGTSVKIYLRRHLGEWVHSEAERPDVEALPRGDGELVLVVEDEAGVRALSVEAVRDLGYTVVAAADGREALDRLDQRPEIRLLFTDVVMPEMNGRELAERALSMRPDLRVLFTTGYAANAIVHHGRLDADVKVVQKPFTLTDLAYKIRATLKQ